MDERLLSLVNGGADVTVKLCKQNTVIMVRYEKNTYRATGGTFQKALDRVLESIKSQTKSNKTKRREKEALREEILDSIAEKEYGYGL